MAKIVDYPRASLANSLQLAEAVSSLGGSCSVEMAADKLGKKVSGAFNALVSSAVKYGLIASKEGRLSVHELYRSIKLAYTDEEKRGFVAKALLSPPIFRAIVERFDGHALPIEHFEKLLVREFDVPADLASRISKYLLQGAREAGILSASGHVSRIGVENEQPADPDVDSEDERDAGTSNLDDTGEANRAKVYASSQEFSISFRGPGLNSTITVREEEDLMIVNAMLKKVSKAIEIKGL